jgi:hypothetical protein
MAGLGAALFTGEVGHGDSVAIFGCGGVGCAAIVGAVLAGATTVIAVDIDQQLIREGLVVRLLAYWVATPRRWQFPGSQAIRWSPITSLLPRHDGLSMV